MKIAEINGCSIHMLAKDHTMVICEPDAVFFRCTLCGEIKSVHMMAGSSEKNIPWLRLCFCGNADNAPHVGGDTQPLTTGEPVNDVAQTVDHQTSDMEPLDFGWNKRTEEVMSAIAEIKPVFRFVEKEQ